MMEEKDNNVSINSQASDYVTSAAKAVLGTVPFVGSLLAEVAGTIIPNQRIDRIVKFAQILEEKLSNLNQNIVRSQLINENFTDLLEEGLRQSARSLSDDRRTYLASVIANSILLKDIEFIEAKHLLKILGEINDIEVIYLRANLIPTLGGDEEFREKHKNILKTVDATFGASQDILDKSTLQKSYDEHLTQLGLLEHRYEINIRTKQTEFDPFTGGMKVSGYEITSLGKLLLRQIDLSESRDTS